MMIRSLGVVVDLSGDYRIVRLKGCHFVIGRGQFIQVKSYEDGRRLIKDLLKMV